MQFHEHIVLDDCELVITDLIIGDDLWTMRTKHKRKLTEEEGRNILYKVTQGIVEYQAKDIAHRDLHSMNIMVHFECL